MQRRGNKRIGIIASMVRMLATIGSSKHLTDFLAHVLADTLHYDLRAVVIPDVQALYAQPIPTAAGRRIVARLLQHCLTEFARRRRSHPSRRRTGNVRPSWAARAEIAPP